MFAARTRLYWVSRATARRQPIAGASMEDRVNTIPKLFLDPTWQGIMSLSGGEQIELAMFGLVSILWIAGMCYGSYRMFRRKPREDAVSETAKAD
jgi:hypothetical protein